MTAAYIGSLASQTTAGTSVLSAYVPTPGNSLIVMGSASGPSNNIATLSISDGGAGNTIYELSGGFQQFSGRTGFRAWLLPSAQALTAITISGTQVGGGNFGLNCDVYEYSNASTFDGAPQFLAYVNATPNNTGPTYVLRMGSLLFLGGLVAGTSTGNITVNATSTPAPASWTARINANVNTGGFTGGFKSAGFEYITPAASGGPYSAGLFDSNGGVPNVLQVLFSLGAPSIPLMGQNMY